MVTDADGFYTIENVPPGKYTLRMWHEGVVTKQEGMNRTYISTPPLEATSPAVVPAGGTVTLDFSLTIPG